MCCEKQLSEHGRSNAFTSSVQKLEKQLEELSAEAGITDDILEKYSKLEKQIVEQTKLLSDVEKGAPQIDFSNEPYVYIPGITDVTFDGTT